jgi:hypothetical protein
MTETDIAAHSRGTDIAHRPADEHREPQAGMPPASPQTTSAWLRLLQHLFSFPVMLGTMLLGAVYFVVRGFVVDPDLWWHIKVGENILATHHLPSVDTYSFTVSGAPWMAYEWLGEVAFAAVARLGGLQALELLLFGLGGAIVVGLYIFATLRSGNSKAGFVAVLGLLPIAIASFTFRPQMFGYLFLIFTLIAMELLRHEKSWALWALPPIFLLWVNIHGSFVIGLGVILVYWLSGLKSFRLGGLEGRAWNPADRLRLEVVFAWCLAVLPITPYGTRLAVYPLDMAFSQPVNVANILEWQPLPLNLLGGKIFLAFLFGFLLLQILFRFVWRLEEVILYVGGTLLAALHVRFILLFVPFFAPIFAAMLARWIPEYERAKDKYILNAVLIGALLVAMVHYVPSKADLQERVAEQFPVHALQYMQLHDIPGPMFNTYGFGGYLVSMGQKVFIDGRGDLYERGGVLADYMHITKMKPGAMAVLQNYQVRACLLERDEPLSTLLSTAPGWKRVYTDKLSALFVREDPAQHGL